ncbi:MAG: autotransporter outer membrane beta-barrel domain-containing protein [Alphaproteobacteria bacterium]|nr:autotransporter outer membrane beta-barrel domain-containing protein [Alphaproteobacteria bacterium]
MPVNSGSSLWVSGFISGEEIGRRKNNLPGTLFEQRGTAAGYNYTLSSGLAFGIFGGSNEADYTTLNNSMKSYENEIQGLFLWVHLRSLRFGTLFINASLSSGVLFHQDRRYTHSNRTQIALKSRLASYKSFWISPEVTLGNDIQFGSFFLTPSVHLRFANQSFDRYREKGRESEILFGIRISHIREMRNQISLSRLLSRSLWFSSNIGVRYLYVMNRALLSLSLETQKRKFATPEQEFQFYFYSGGDLRISLGEKAMLKVRSEIRFREEKTHYNTKAGLEVSF